jgi:hypothetical protein
MGYDAQPLRCAVVHDNVYQSNEALWFTNVRNDSR